MSARMSYVLASHRSALPKEKGKPKGRPKIWILMGVGRSNVNRGATIWADLA
jgi:hypothetical protein